MNAVLHGQQVDRFPFVPSIYEHGARVIGKSPYETSRSAELTAMAALKSWETYQHDLVTVGVDIYNVEVEAFGCELSKGSERAIPGVISHPLENSSPLDINGLATPEASPDNRMQMLVDATRRVVEEIGDEVWVLSTMAGPFSQAVELRGFEGLIVDMMESPELVHGLMQKTTELSIQQARRISETGAGVSIFESWGTIPLITPEIFGEYVVPYNKRVIDMIKSDYDVPPPAVIMGGDTAKLMDHFIEVGTSLVVADYMTDFEFMKEKTRGHKMIIRGCADPKMIEREQWDGVGKAVQALAGKKKGMTNFVWGCGAVSFDTTIEALLRFKQMCLEADMS
jgi:uroporphyrinogen decarboxylase